MLYCKAQGRHYQTVGCDFTVVLPACSFPPTLPVELLVWPRDELDQKWTSWGKKKNKHHTNQQQREGRKSLRDPFPDVVSQVTSQAMPEAGMSGLNEEGRGCLSQHLSTTDSAVKLLPPAFSQTGSLGLKGLTLHNQPWLTQLHLSQNTKTSFTLLVLQ